MPSAIGPTSAGQDRRVVAEVGVHLDDGRRAAAERDPEAIEIGAAEALLGRPMADADARVAGGQLVGEPAGAVGRAVVDDEQRRRRAAPSRIAAVIGPMFSASS